MNCMRIATVALLLACACTVAARAQEFSAIGVARDSTGHVVKSKVQMSGNKVRVDPQETGTANEQAYDILDLAQRTSTRNQRGPNGKSANRCSGKPFSPAFGWTQSCTFGPRWKSWLAPLCS